MKTMKLSETTEDGDCYSVLPSHRSWARLSLSSRSMKNGNDCPPAFSTNVFSISTSTKYTKTLIDETTGAIPYEVGIWYITGIDRFSVSSYNWGGKKALYFMSCLSTVYQSHREGACFQGGKIPYRLKRNLTSPSLPWPYKVGQLVYDENSRRWKSPNGHKDLEVSISWLGIWRPEAIHHRNGKHWFLLKQERKWVDHGSNHEILIFREQAYQIRYYEWVLGQYTSSITPFLRTSQVHIPPWLCQCFVYADAYAYNIPYHI